MFHRLHSEEEKAFIHGKSAGFTASKSEWFHENKDIVTLRIIEKGYLFYIIGKTLIGNVHMHHCSRDTWV